jgi:hypothetical protein
MPARHSGGPGRVRFRVFIAIVIGSLPNALAGCGVSGHEPSARSMARQVPGTTVVVQRPFAFLTRGSAALASLVAGAPGGPLRSCPQRSIRGVLAGSKMEVDLFGTHAPSCRVALAELRRVPLELRSGFAGRVGEWRCVWTELGSIGCRRDSTVLAASDPGE